MLHEFENQFHRPIGEVIRIPVKFIDTSENPNPVVVKTIAKQLSDTGINVLPVFVVETVFERYKPIHNEQILEAAKLAGLDFVMCTIVEETTGFERFQVEMGLKYPKIDVETATVEQIADGVAFLKATNKAFAKVDPESVAKEIVTQRDTKRIRTFGFLAGAKVGVGKAKVPIVAQLFR